MESADASDHDSDRLLAPADFSPDSSFVDLRGGIDGGGTRVAMLGLGALATTDRDLQVQVAELQNSLCALVCVESPVPLDTVCWPSKVARTVGRRSQSVRDCAPPTSLMTAVAQHGLTAKLRPQAALARSASHVRLVLAATPAQPAWATPPA